MSEHDQITIDFSTPELTSDEARVWHVISRRRGKAAAILGRDIEAQTLIPYKAVQELIAHLVTDHDRLVASCTRGYFVPVTEEEVIEATRSLRHRAILILCRAARFQRTSLEDVFGQAKIEYEKAG